jgi:DNA polymerase III subunit epsilon
MSAAETPDFVRAYLARFESTWSDDDLERDIRFVVLDSETTGLDARKDRLITLGAVAVRHDEIVLGDSFEALVKIEHNLQSVTVHGITREQSQTGLDEAEALRLFLAYLGDGVIVGHHIMHDVEILNVACERHWGFELRNRSLDTMDLTLNLERDGAFAGQPEIRSFSLDSLCKLFDVKPHDRHTAPGDAFITAKIFLRLLALARRHGRETLSALCEPVRVEGKN